MHRLQAPIRREVPCRNPETIGQPIPPVGAIQRECDEPPTVREYTSHGTEYACRRQHVLEHTHTDHDVDRVVRDRPEILCIVHAITNRPIARFPARMVDHPRGQVDPNPALHPIGERTQVRSVAAPHVQYNVVGPKLGVTIQQTQTMLEEHVRIPVPLEIRGGKVVEKRSDLLL